MKLLRRLIVALVLLPALLATAAVTLRTDDPPAPPAVNGQLSGKLGASGPIEGLQAICRDTGKTFRPASFDGQTGEFLFNDLPGDACYDLTFSVGGRHIEGIDLSFVDARLIRLAEQRREDLGLPPERSHDFQQADVDELLTFVRDMKDFMDIRRVLYLSGQGRRATMLVELMRARDFYDSKDNELIWRVELWYFENQFGGWQRLANQELVLRRQRLGEPKWRRIHVEYYPELSVQIDRQGNSQPVDFQLPAQADASRGRPADSPIELNTEPHIMGVQPAPSAEGKGQGDERK